MTLGGGFLFDLGGCFILLGGIIPLSVANLFAGPVKVSFKPLRCCLIPFDGFGGFLKPLCEGLW